MLYGRQVKVKHIFVRTNNETCEQKQSGGVFKGVLVGLENITRFIVIVINNVTIYIRGLQREFNSIYCSTVCKMLNTNH